MIQRLSSTTNKIAYVRHVAGEAELQIRLQYLNKERRFQRSIDEPLSKLVKRIQKIHDNENYGGNTNRKHKKKRKGKSNDTSSSSPPISSPDRKSEIHLLDKNDQVISPHIPLLDALQQAVKLSIISDKNTFAYPLCWNQPTITELTLQHFQNCHVGLPIVPKLDMEFCSMNECVFQWTSSNDEHNEDIVGTNFMYTPSIDDIGKSLRVKCVPPRSAELLMSSSKERVEIQSTERSSKISGFVESIPLQRQILFHPRILWGQPNKIMAASDDSNGTVSSTNNDFRVVSYNVLYDRYAKQFFYCDTKYIQEMYRMPLILKEFMEYNADIVCTQEMGKSIYANYFQPLMLNMGYTSKFGEKAGSTPEGCAIFVRDDKFDILDTMAFISAQQIVATRHADLRNKLSILNPSLESRIRQLPTTSQIHVLRHKATQNIVLIVNMHAYFKGDADFIRLVQVSMLVKELEHLRKEKYTSAAVIFCGDLNSDPKSIAMDYVFNGTVSELHEEWKAVAASAAVDENNDKIQGLINGLNYDPSIAHSFYFENGSDSTHFTTFTPNFVDTLDYILYSRDKLQSFNPMPMFERTQVMPGLPNQYFPSDHVAIGCDFRWLK